MTCRSTGWPLDSVLDARVTALVWSIRALEAQGRDVYLIEGGAKGSVVYDMLRPMSRRTVNVVINTAIARGLLHLEECGEPGGDKHAIALRAVAGVPHAD
jgi:hypothetical protein